MITISSVLRFGVFMKIFGIFHVYVISPQIIQHFQIFLRHFSYHQQLRKYLVINVYSVEIVHNAKKNKQFMHCHFSIIPFHY